MRIFVTVGTTKFEDLILKIDSIEFLLTARNLGCTHLVIQVGNGQYKPSAILKNAEGIHVEYYRFKVDYIKDVEKADLIISHAGNNV